MSRSGVDPALIPFLDAVSELIVANYLRREACPDARKPDSLGTTPERPASNLARHNRQRKATS
jgi:hypothetical protein